jgi:hypothetical protein
MTPGDLVVDVARVVREDEDEAGAEDDEDEGPPKASAKTPAKAKK